MNILLIGSGGREHTLAWKMKQSPLLEELYISPGNAGTMDLGKNVSIDINNHKELKQFLVDHKIEIVVVGPEQPLVDGIHDKIAADAQLNHITVIGPKQEAAQLEGSKDYAKQFMSRHQIPTADYQTFDKSNLQDGLSFLEKIKAPYVLKADGLAAGKGVVILEDLEEAKATLTEMIADEKFGDASRQVVIEEFLSGVELSVFVLTDGESYVLLPEAKDYKRIGEGDSGLNTGGMGSISPVPFADEQFMTKVKNQVIDPTINGLQKDNIDFQGFVFFGLINVNGNPFVIEYNVRMGDPETESVLPRLKTDLVALFKATGNKDLKNSTTEFDSRTAASVMMVSGGYPGSYEKGKEMTGLNASENQVLFHAGTKFEEGKVLTNGGRVIAITTLAENMEEALKASYATAEKIQYNGKYYRKDLGFDL